MKLPPAAAVARMLSDLLGRSCTVRPTAKPAFSEQGLIGLLVDPTGATKALSFSDRSFAASSGAALALIPRAVAEDAIAKGVVPENLFENHREIINVATTLFNVLHSDADHLRLTQMLATGPSVPQAIRTFLVKPSARMDLEVEIVGYGVGKLSLLV